MNYADSKSLFVILISNMFIAVNCLEITTPANGSTVFNNINSISGMFVCHDLGGSPINLKLDGITIGDTIAKICQFGPQSRGLWIVPLTKALSIGSHTLLATLKTSAGKIYTATSTFKVVALNVLITTPKNNSTVNVPLFIQGAAQPGSNLVIQIINTKTSQITVAKLTVDSSGFWSFNPTQVRLGNNVVRVTATSPLGIVSNASASFTLVASNSNSSCG